MAFSDWPYLARAAVLLGSIYIIYQAYVQITVGSKRRAMQREKGTMPVVAFPAKDPILGLDKFRENIRALKAHRMLELTSGRFRSMNANTFSTLNLGRRVIITSEPENLKTIQAIDFKKWSLGSRRKNGFRPLLGLGIFTTDGADWQHSREMLRPNFVRSQIGDLDTFERHVAHLISAIPTNGSTVDLSELFFRLTIDSATEFLFGESTESLTKESESGFAGSFTRSQDHIGHLSRWGRWAFLAPTNKEWDHDRKFVHDFVDYYVEKGLAKRSQLLSEKSNAEQPGRYVFMDELVRQTTDKVRIRSELLNILLAGRDTTASLLTNLWFILAQRPDLWSKLQDEVRTLNGEQPTWERMKDMKYLKALLNESLRLHPVVPANSREATEDTTLPTGGGPNGDAPIFIHKGQVVVWNLYYMHRRKDFYGPDAEEFKPERWLDDPVSGRKGLRPGWEYLPFNGGPRICLGQQFALTEASYTTIRLCQAFSKIESRDTEPWTEMLTLTCVNLGGAKVALTPRDS